MEGGGNLKGTSASQLPVAAVACAVAERGKLKCLLTTLKEHHDHNFCGSKVIAAQHARAHYTCTPTN